MSRIKKGVDSSWWDVVIPAAFATILGFVFKDDAFEWWGREYTVTNPTSISVNQVLGEASWTAAAIVFIIVAGCAFLFIKGQKRLLRAVRVSAFLAVVLATGIHFATGGESGAPQQTALPQGFVVAINKFMFFMITAGLGGILFLLAVLLGLAALVHQTSKEDWQALLLGLNVLAFMEMMWVTGAVKRWSDVSGLALLGVAAATFEMLLCAETSRFWLIVGSLLGILWYACVGLAGYQLFLSAWGPVFV